MPELGDTGRALARVSRYGALAAVLVATTLVWRTLPMPKLSDFRLPSFRVHETAATNRKIYPYSVIVGGAYSAEELARARKTDGVVARHYSRFGESAKVLRMPTDTLMYVSYRKSNQVFWTKAKHRIPKGETVLCDGDDFARTRCGNRLSGKPQAPVAESGEPTEEALNIPEGPKVPLAASDPLLATPEADFFIPGNPADLSSLLSSPFSQIPGFTASRGGSTGADRLYPIGPTSGPGSFFPNGGVGYPIFPTANMNTTLPRTITETLSPAEGVVTPEPGTLLLLVLGLTLSGAGLCYRKYDRRRPCCR